MNNAPLPQHQCEEAVQQARSYCPCLRFLRYCEFRICGTNGVAARPKCGCELSPRPYIFSADRLCEGKATEKENSPGTMISRLFWSADSRTPTCMRELSHGPDGSVTLVKNVPEDIEHTHYPLILFRTSPTIA